VWFDPAVLALRVAKAEGVENEQVLSGTREQAEEGLRRYQEWKDGRASVLERGAAPRYRVSDGRVGNSVERGGWDSCRDGHAPDRRRPPYRPEIRPRSARYSPACDFGRRCRALAEIWGRRHARATRSAPPPRRRRAGLEYIARIMPAGAERHRELPVMVRLEDGMLVDGRIDFAWRSGNLWTVVDYKTDRREKRNITQVQLYALALQRATKIPARGLVLEV
jgi:hypothetical protein